MTSQPTTAEIRVGEGNYVLGRQLGAGSFGEVYKAIDVRTKEFVAVKLELISCTVPQLTYEARVLKFLHHGCPYVVGFPTVRWCGTEGDYVVMVFDLLGPSLGKLFSHCEKRFSPKTVAMLAIQAFSRLEYLHAKSFLHRDIKPENFLMGVGKRGHHLYMIDLGLAKKFRDPKTMKHIPFREGKSLTGTARFVSIWTHLGVEQSRRDDLMSLCYMLVLFAKGSLPWSGVRDADRQGKLDRICEKKSSTAPETLCRGLPTSLLALTNYAKDLQFEEEPNYQKCREWFETQLAFEGAVNDYRFDWLVRPARDQDDASSRASGDSSRKVSMASSDMRSRSEGPEPMDSDESM
jgi:serine/threonine protein kinase